MINNIGRRDFLRSGALFAAAATTLGLAGCGDGEATSPVAGSLAGSDPPALTPSADQLTFNGVLLLGYVSAQYHALAATGSALRADRFAGLEQGSTVTGGRGVGFTSPIVAALAARFSQDKPVHVATLQARLQDVATWQPTVDFTAGSFGLVAQEAGIVPPGSSFDPFADEASYLLGALFLEREVAAAYRSAALTLEDPVLAETVYGLLPDAIYHDGLLRSTIAAQAAESQGLLEKSMAIETYMAGRDGSSIVSGDDTAEAPDMLGQAVPVLRSAKQAMGSQFIQHRAVACGASPIGTNPMRA